MSAEKIEKIEAQMFEQQKLLGRMESTLEAIAKNIEEAISIKNEVITQKEKHKVTEARLIDLEKDMKDMTKQLNGVNVKIAMASGIWTAIVFFISKL